MSVKRTLTRSFLVGYGAGAGHSAWRATKANAGTILLVGALASLIAGPLYFVYALGHALANGSGGPAAYAKRVALNAIGAIGSAWALGWILYMAVFVLSAAVPPEKVPGHSLVPEAAVRAVMANAEASMDRSLGLLSSSGAKRTVSSWSDDPAKHREEVAAANLVVRTYALTLAVGALLGFASWRREARDELTLAHNATFMHANGLGVAEDGTLVDGEGNAYRVESRSPERIVLLALHRRNMRARIDFDDQGRMTAWSGIHKKGQA